MPPIQQLPAYYANPYKKLRPATTGVERGTKAVGLLQAASPRTAVSALFLFFLFCTKQVVEPAALLVLLRFNYLLVRLVYLLLLFRRRFLSQGVAAAGTECNKEDSTNVLHRNSP